MKFREKLAILLVQNLEFTWFLWWFFTQIKGYISWLHGNEWVSQSFHYISASLSFFPHWLVLRLTFIYQTRIFPRYYLYHYCSSINVIVLSVFYHSYSASNGWTCTIQLQYEWKLFMFISLFASRFSPCFSFWGLEDFSTCHRLDLLLQWIICYSAVMCKVFVVITKYETFFFFLILV